MSAGELRERRVLIVGAGGLGCPASLALARAGIGAMTLVDPDVVDVTNLHRQLWHTDADVGTAKVDSAAAKLRAAFPGLKVEARQEAVTSANVGALFAGVDLVIDGTDGVATKFMLSDAAVRAQVPLVYGGVLRMQGQAMLIAPGGPCLRCLFETPPSADDIPTCAQAGVLGSMAGLIGALQAVIAIRALATNVRETRLDGVATLRVVDGLTLRAREVRVRRSDECPACNGTWAMPAIEDEGRAACRI